MVDLETLQANLERVRSKIEEAARRSGRDAGAVKLLAVSKTWPVEVLEVARQAGVRSFGENRVQELEEKVPQLPGSLDWHLIGHLQKNKVRKVLPLAGTIHSVDSLEIAERMDRIAEEEGLYPRIYWQVNLAEEASKTGFSPASLRAAAEPLMGLQRLELEGLMVIPPFHPEPEEVRRYFAALRELRDDLEEELGVNLPGLSMGMSHDFGVAIEEGATIVRVGSALFGPRGT